MFVSGAGTGRSWHRDSRSAFFGPYKEVTPTGASSGPMGPDGSVTTVTFAEKGGKRCWSSAACPSKEALDAAGTRARIRMGETFEQLDELLVTLGAAAHREIVDLRSAPGSSLRTYARSMDAHEWPRRRLVLSREPMDARGKNPRSHFCRLSWALASDAPPGRGPRVRALPGLVPSSDPVEVRILRGQIYSLGVE